MENNFNKSLDFVLNHEGGYVWDKNDPGSETKFGISKKAYPELDIKNLTLEKASEIYRRDYWNKCNCNDIEWPFDIIIFDTAVNMSTTKALVLYQENKTWQDYLFARISFYCKISNKTNNKYLRGWILRVIDLYLLVKKGN